MKTLPNRAFRSPALICANFDNYTKHINLIRLNKPYANGNAYAVYQTTNAPGCESKLFKTYEQAKKSFDVMVQISGLVSDLIEVKETGNAIYLAN